LFRFVHFLKKSKTFSFELGDRNFLHDN
jgi:hypothetical protein